MSGPRFRSILILLAGAAGLSACADEGYGYGGGMSVGYGAGRGCDPRYDDCGYGSAYGYGDYGYDYGGYYGDPWYGWYGDYYYPGIGFFVFDREGRRHRWSDNDRRFWEGRRGQFSNRNWNDQRWQRWDGFRNQGVRSGGTMNQGNRGVRGAAPQGGHSWNPGMRGGGHRPPH
jgi:hypothetical protein